MARPRKEGLDYFPHDTDASSDEKVDSMRALFGNDGYTFYFYLCERIYRTSTAELDLSKYVLIAPIIKKLLVDRERFEEMLDAAFELSLFSRTEYEERGVLTSSGIKKRFREVSQMREKWRKNKQNTPETGVIHEENVGENAEVTGESKAKESKVKEIIKPSSYSHSPVNAFGMYEREIGELSYSVSQKLIFLEEVYTEEWLKKAIETAVFAGVKQIRFIEGTLKNWQKLNHLEPWTVEKQPESQQTNVHHFPRRGTGQAPKPRNPIPIPQQAASISAERLEEIRRLAQEMDEDFNNKRPMEV